MDKENVFSAFTKNLVTLNDLNNLILDVEELQGAVYTTGKKSLSQKVSARVSQGFGKIIKTQEEEKKLPSNLQELSNYFDELKSFLLGLPQLRLELAFDPSLEFLSQISNWFEATGGKKVILAISVNPQILAGVRIEFGGKFRDYSLGKRLEEYFKISAGPPTCRGLL